jgi:hypothetical protein
MRGVITGRDVAVHALTIVRLWGVTTFLACVWAAITGRPRTFLGVLYPSTPVRPEHARRGLAFAPPRWRTSR